MVRLGSSTRSTCSTAHGPVVMRFFKRPVSRSYRYSWPQLSRSENQISSWVANRACQFTRPNPDSNCVAVDSANTSRTTPVAASALRTCSFLWSREVETNTSRAPSGLHSTSAQRPPHST